MTNCPKCTSEKLVETAALGEIKVDGCPSCSGIWFEAGELEALVKRSQANADLALIDPKSVPLECPACANKMSRGGLVNPLLLVDKCEACGGVWLDANELALLKKLLGIAEGPSGVSVERAAAPEAAPAPKGTGAAAIAGGLAILLGLSGLSYEIYQYLNPAAAETGAFSPLMAGVSVLLCGGGVFGLRSGR